MSNNKTKVGKLMQMPKPDALIQPQPCWLKCTWRLERWMMRLETCKAFQTRIRWHLREMIAKPCERTGRYELLPLWTWRLAPGLYDESQFGGKHVVGYDHVCDSKMMTKTWKDQGSWHMHNDCTKILWYHSAAQCRTQRKMWQTFSRARVWGIMASGDRWRGLNDYVISQWVKGNIGVRVTCNIRSNSKLITTLISC